MFKNHYIRKTAKKKDQIKDIFLCPLCNKNVEASIERIFQNIIENAFLMEIGIW